MGLEAEINKPNHGAVSALCIRNAIFTALPSKSNGQAALNSTIHFEDTIVVLKFATYNSHPGAYITTHD